MHVVVDGDDYMHIRHMANIGIIMPVSPLATEAVAGCLMFVMSNKIWQLSQPSQVLERKSVSGIRRHAGHTPVRRRQLVASRSRVQRPRIPPGVDIEMRRCAGEAANIAAFRCVLRIAPLLGVSDGPAVPCQDAGVVGRARGVASVRDAALTSRPAAADIEMRRCAVKMAKIAVFRCVL